MIVHLDTRRDTRRLAEAIAQASWLGDIPWKEQKPSRRREWLNQARSILDALSGQPSPNRSKE